MIASLVRQLWQLLVAEEPSGQIPPHSRTSLLAQPMLEALEDRAMLDGSLATVPLPGWGFIGAQEAVVQQMPRGNPNIVFLGDSITYYFQHGAGAPVWQQNLAPLGSLNLAIGGQTTSNVLYQLDSGVLYGTEPQVIVLMIGTNNLLTGQAPLDTAEGIVADVEMIHAVEPFSQILVLGIPPSSYLPQEEVNLTNLLAANTLRYLPYASEVQWADVTDGFLQPDGTIANGMLVDGIHPSTLGYVIEAGALARPLFIAALSWYDRLLALEQSVLEEYYLEEYVAVEAYLLTHAT